MKLWILAGLHGGHAVELRGRQRGDDLGAYASGAVEFPLTRTAGAGWYTVAMSVGGRDTNVIVDTASPWLWSYGSNASATSNDEPSSDPPPFSIQYMSARVAGVIEKESLSFAGSGQVAGADAVGLQGQAGHAHTCSAGVATEGDEFWSRQFQNSGVQGVLGVSCGAADSGTAVPEGAGADAQLDSGLGCAASSATADGFNNFALQLRDDGGTLSFGDVPPSLLSGLVKMPPMIRCGQWRAPLHVKVGDKTLGHAESILDSAAIGIVGPAEAVAHIASTLEAKIEIRDSKLVYTLPCSRRAALKPLTLQLGSGELAEVALTGEQLVIQDGEEGTAKCRLALAGWDSPQWLLGMPFFRAIRGAAFDVMARSLYIAP